ACAIGDALEALEQSRKCRTQVAREVAQGAFFGELAKGPIRKQRGLLEAKGFKLWEQDVACGADFFAQGGALGEAHFARGAVAVAVEGGGNGREGWGGDGSGYGKCCVHGWFP